jgi:hypothetical protein
MTLYRIPKSDGGNWLFILSNVTPSVINLLTPTKKVFTLSIASLAKNNEGLYVTKDVISTWLEELDTLYKVKYSSLTLKLKGNTCEILFKKADQEYVNQFVQRLSNYLAK